MQQEHRLKNRLRRAGRWLVKSLPFLLISILALCLMIVISVVILLHGPSEDAGRLFTLSCRESSALKRLPSWFASQERLQELLDQETDDVSASQWIPVEFEAGNTETPDTGDIVSQAEDNTVSEFSSFTLTDAEGLMISEGVSIQMIAASNYKGKIMIVSDPSRVFFASVEHFGSHRGEYLYEFIQRTDALAGTNAGGFYDPDGNGNGSIPDGLVISDGAIAYGSAGTWYNNIIGFDANHILHVGSSTAAAALEEGVVSAVSFSPGPVLVSDGQRQTDLGGGLNPRTCIGQRADGAVIIAVIEGRKPDSLGATYDDLAEIMLELGAVNAANLDGGSSSLMYYNGEQITRGSNIVGMRPMATALLVMK